MKETFNQKNYRVGYMQGYNEALRNIRSLETPKDWDNQSWNEAKEEIFRLLNKK